MNLFSLLSGPGTEMGTFLVILRMCLYVGCLSVYVYVCGLCLSVCIEMSGQRTGRALCPAQWRPAGSTCDCLQSGH